MSIPAYKKIKNTKTFFNNKLLFKVIYIIFLDHRLYKLKNKYYEFKSLNIYLKKIENLDDLIVDTWLKEIQSTNNNFW